MKKTRELGNCLPSTPCTLQFALRTPVTFHLVFLFFFSTPTRGLFLNEMEMALLNMFFKQKLHCDLYNSDYFLKSHVLVRTE